MEPLVPPQQRPTKPEAGIRGMLDALTQLRREPDAPIEDVDPPIPEQDKPRAPQM